MEMEKDFIDEFIPSKDTRAYLHSIHHEFTDFEKATIVANHIMISYEKKVKWLEQFMPEYYPLRTPRLVSCYALFK